MDLHYLPSHGWRVIYPVEPRECSSMEAFLTSDMYSVMSLRAVALGLSLFYIFTNNLPLVLHEAGINMYAYDSTLYMTAPKGSELTDILNRKLWSVSEWVINSKLVLITSKTKSIVYGSKLSLRPKPQLELCIKGVTIEKVQEAKLPGITLDGKLSWVSHIDKVVVKMLHLL